MKCEALLGPQHDPCAVRGHGTIGDPFGRGGLPRCERLAHTFELVGGPRLQLPRESVQGDGVGPSFRHDEQAAIRSDQEGFGVVRAVGYVA